MAFYRHQLANGLQIVAECHPEAYTAAIGFFVRVGSRDEPPQWAGVSHFLEHMAFKGSEGRTADEVNRSFDEIGAHYNAFTGQESTVFYAAIVPEYWPQALELLADLLQPAFREEDFELERKVILEEISMHEDEPPFGADDKCREVFFGSHPLGHSVLGSLTTIGALTPGDMREYWRKFYSADNITLAGAGRIDFDQLVAEADKWCGKWPSGQVSRQVSSPDGASGWVVLSKPTATQEYLVHMTKGPMEDDDFFAASLLASIVGDSEGSRLFWEFVESGEAENANLRYLDYEDTGIFITHMICDPGRAQRNLDRLFELYQQLVREGITEDELLQAKSKVSSGIVLASERPRNRLFAVGGEWLYHKRYRSVREVLDKIAAVTRDQICDILQRFPLNTGTLVAIGPLNELSRPEAMAAKTEDGRQFVPRSENRHSVP